LEKKLKALQVTKNKADSQKDIDLINVHAVSELTPDDVYVFSVVLCDNNVDRDNERIDDEGLKKMEKLFVGATGIFNHSWNAKDQVARIYDVKTHATGELNSIGEAEKQLIASVYILREFNEEIISKIEGGILKEVSIGFSVEKLTCSICGSEFNWWSGICKENEHKKGNVYNDEMCYGLLKNPLDAYEFSFVAVPEQKNAGVTKEFGDIEKEVEYILDIDLSERPDIAQKIINHCNTALMSNDERLWREKIKNKNLEFLNGGKSNDTV
jgi:hypothetical protein